MTPQDRSKPPLHNFSLPCFKWGYRRTLKCVKVADLDPDQSKPISSLKIRNPIPIHENGNPTSLAPPPHLRFNNATVASASAKRLKVSPFLEEEVKGGITANCNGNGNDDSAARPWNLRTRRAACKLPLKIEEKRNNNNNNNNHNNVDSFRRNLEINSPRRNDSTCVVKKQSVEKLKFSVPLLKEEIEHDFFEIARIRPPRRPKKRPRIVQKYLDSIFPGLWLSEVTPDSYKVPDVPET